MKEIKYHHSKAEQRFYEWFTNTYPNLSVIKKGMPDFMILDENNEILGFVEVKRDDLNDTLREEQRYFKRFCKKHNISYQVWSPIMGTSRWEKCSERFKKAMMAG